MTDDGVTQSGSMAAMTLPGQNPQKLSRRSHGIVCYNLLLIRYTLERMLYRLSISDQRDQFLLKGALLFDLWFDVPHRPTHDAGAGALGEGASA